jgi:hypothetical protein
MGETRDFERATHIFFLEVESMIPYLIALLDCFTSCVSPKDLLLLDDCTISH